MEKTSNKASPKPSFTPHNRPPSPPIHRLHHSFSQKYGLIFFLNLGSRLMVVLSSSAAAEECLAKNDVVFANRPKFNIAKHLGYNNTTVVSSSYRDHWRNLRRIGATEIFSPARLNATVNARKDEMWCLLARLSNESLGEFAKVELKSMLSDLMFNNVMRTVGGEKSGTGNPADYLPVLNWFGLGFGRELKKLAQRMDVFLQKLIDDHRSKSCKITVIIMAGTDTSSVTIEWAMANLLNHPLVLKKARDEIDSLIGEENLIEESDVPKLHYLQSIMYETLRLYPAVPLLIPHMPSTDCTIGGYDVPSGAIVLVNAWTIHRDPKAWDDPESFKPERFDGNGEKIEQSHKLLPFGLGRRACPGANLAQRMVGLALGSLIQCFEWERIDGKEIDMIEGKGSIMPKAHSLQALCKPRSTVNKVFY
ncbi:Cytochrome P450 81D11 [Hibiscus syriacus]|uniref:Cytochrome P450 81D11 n=1 Tax=Hibiscus syriacus TaxID=106335 RepID=A0A6A2XK54_HIBSY|nr:Cytochrome P450 81D11 [Hibiscus syriacus]